MEKNDIESIVNHAKELKLGVIKDILDDILAEASEHQWSYSMFLNELLHREVEHRAENRKYQRIRKACFPQMKYLHEIVREDLPDDARNLLPELESMNFIKEACMEGFSVYFTTVPHLLTQIREARNSRALQLLETRFRKFDLVICDEMGYVSFDKEGAEMLFNHISMRAGVRSTVITTNLPFTRWEEIIKDKVLCSALVDRLCHKAFLLNMTGQSFRVKETQRLLKI